MNQLEKQNRNNPKYPVYIISKGRYESRLTSKALEKMNVPYYIVVEPQEYDLYASVIDKDKILILPFSNVGSSIPARNWVWEHSIENGHERHWILDDNIRQFFRLHNNRLYKVDSGVCFRVIEDWVDRYENIAQAGMQYKAFIPRRQKKPPVSLNTRIYSCILIKNDIPYRWRGQYNEDTDLSLRILKGGWVTALFYIFNCDKQATMSMKGGNTEMLYNIDNGRLKMALALKQKHPRLVKITQKWGRWQHSVDYRPFKGNKLIYKKGIKIPSESDNYGMRLIDL